MQKPLSGTLDPRASLRVKAATLTTPVSTLPVRGAHNTNKYHSNPQRCISSAAGDADSRIRRIPVKKPGWERPQRGQGRATMSCLAR